MVDLSIVVPAFNEEHRLEKSIHTIEHYFTKKESFEIIIVDDGSSDHTKQKAELLKNDHIKVVSYKTNRGKGYAVAQGVLHASGSKILFSDADLSTPIEEYEKLRFWYDKGYKICIASRRMRSSDIRFKQPLHRRISGRAFGLIARLIVGDIHDTQCGFKLFHTQIAKRLFKHRHLDGFSFDVEILYLAKKMKIPVKEVPVVWRDEATHSKVNISKHAIEMFFDLIKIKMRH